MKRILQQTLVLSFDELKILLFSQGYVQCEGVFMPEKFYSPEEVLNTMLHLSRQGLIFEEDGSFEIREDLAQMLPVIGNPAGTMIVRNRENGKSYFCYIVPDKIVVSEKTMTKDQTVRLRMFTKESFISWKEQMDNDYREY